MKAAEPRPTSEWVRSPALFCRSSRSSPMSEDRARARTRRQRTSYSCIELLRSSTPPERNHPLSSGRGAFGCPSAMASRTKQKEEARARRLAEEQARAEKERRTRRLQMLGGVVLIAVAIIAVAIAVSSGSGGSNNAAKLTSNANKTGKGHVVPCQGSPDSAVCSLLSGIPQSGNTLGNPHAKVTVTEFGDLECSVCDAFAIGSNDTTSAGTPGTGLEDQLIRNDVRSGKVKLVYRSLETASGGNPDQSAFLNQQVAAES